MPWAAAADVTARTGITVTEAQLGQAQGVVEIFADTTEDASDAGMISSKNLRLLRNAVAYQAAWITQHPDAFTNIDTTQIQQDGIVATWTHHNATVLAPLAKRCIDRLSWRRTRPLRIGAMGSGGGRIPRRMNLTNAAADDDDPRWQPLDPGGAA